MGGRKGLGMGLDMLLAPSETGPGKEKLALGEAKSYFVMAQDRDESGQELEAFYYYRRVIDSLEPASLRKEANELLSQAYNNAAVIQFEHGAVKEARDYLEKALQVIPQNKVARENLQVIINLD